MSNLKIIRLPEVIELTSLCRSSIYAGMKDGTFPKSITLGPRTIGWLHDDIQEWIFDRIEGVK